MPMASYLHPEDGPEGDNNDTQSYESMYSSQDISSISNPNVTLKVGGLPSSNMMEAEADHDYFCSEASRAPFRSADNHTLKAFKHLNELRKRKLLCDVTLVAGNMDSVAHRAVLASCSPYFNAMFTNEVTESKAERIVIHQVDGQALCQLVEFIYTGEVHVNEDNVQTLLPAANLFQLHEVREACCEFLKSQLHPTNCLGIQQFADVHSCSDLLNYARVYAETHFSEVLQQDEEFLNLSFAQVEEFIKSDRVSATEEQVFHAVIRWIQKEQANRECFAGQLFAHVRFPLLPKELLVKLSRSDNFLKENFYCKDYLLEALTYHLMSVEEKSQYQSGRTKPRTPIGQPKILVVIGGQAPKAIRTVECYDFKSEKWFSVSEMSSRRCRCGVAVLNGLVYVVGGFNGSLRVRTVEVYDPISDNWSSAAPMEARRSTLGVAVMDNFIYAVGGFDGTTGLSTAECYDPRTNEWRRIGPLSIRRSSVGVGVLDNYLYAVGGYDGASRQCLASVERYDSKTDQWHLVSDMTCRRSGAGVCVLDGMLYAVGGHDGPLVRNCVEMYNPETDSWHQVANMHLCRRNAGVVPYNGFLYVVGGDDGSSNLGSVECYDPKIDTWTLLSSSMMTGRSYAGVAIIERSIV